MKARWFTLIVLFSVVLIIISCSAQQVKQDNQALQDNKGGNNQPEQGPPINNQNNKVKDPIQPNSRQSDQDKYKGVIEEVEKQYQVEEQKKRFESQELYKMALSYYNIQDFEKARELVQKALEKYPGNLDAKQLLDDVNKITTKRSGEFEQIKNDQIERAKKLIEQAEAEITNHIVSGEVLFKAQQYDDAIKELETAEIKLRTAPDYIPLKEMLPKITDMIKKAKDAKVIEEQRVNKLQKKQAEDEIGLLAEAEKREILQKIKDLLDLTYLAIDQKKYDKAIALCDEILLIDPHYKAAIELKEDVKVARHKYQNYVYLKQKIESWKNMKDQDGEALIPYSDLIRFPVRRDWIDISKRSAGLLSKEEGIQDDPDVLAIKSKIESVKISLDFTGVKLDNIIDYIRDYTGLNIVVSDSARAAKSSEFDKPITFKVNDLVLKQGLKLLLEPLGLNYTIEQRVLLITDTAVASGKLTIQLYDVKDILIKLQDFIGPHVTIEPPPSAVPGRSGGGATFNLPQEPQASGIPEDQLVEVIKSNIAGGNWQQFEQQGASIDLQADQGMLAVNAPLSIHSEIKAFLQKLRAYGGIMVAIEAKFISAYDDFLQDVGIDIRGANVGADFNDGTTVTRPGYYATRGMANNSSNWDLRVQTFQTWLNAQGVGELSTFSPGSSITPVLAPTHPSGAGLSGQGGLGLQYQMLGNQALQLVLKALHKDERVTLIQQPNITTFSGQRSNITVLRQIAYIQDVEVQTGALLGGYDPIVNILNVGAVLDVRPIVSNDKKYVKMDLRLYQLSLNAFTTYDVFNAGLNIQLPNINYQQAETTVQMADRGTILISGFKNITNRDLEAKTPFLGEIPILSFFFSRKVKENEHQNELILVTPRIIDLGEEEEKLK